MTPNSPTPEYVLVPREPTDAMVCAGFLTGSNEFQLRQPADAPSLVWAAMIAAAPESAAPSEGPSEGVTDAVRAASAAVDAYWQDPLHAVKCLLCDGRGYVHLSNGDPEHCGACGGNGDVHTGTDEGALTAALAPLLALLADVRAEVERLRVSRDAYKRDAEGLLAISKAAADELAQFVRPHEFAARYAIETFLLKTLGTVPAYRMVEQDAEDPAKVGWAFWIDPEELPAGADDSTSYVHADLSVEWAGTSWEPPCAEAAERDARELRGIVRALVTLFGHCAKDATAHDWISRAHAALTTPAASAASAEQQDAARLDWLETNATYTDCDGWQLPFVSEWFGPVPKQSAATLREAIDARIAASAEGEK